MSEGGSGTSPSRSWPRWWPVLPLGLVALLVIILLAQKPSAPLAGPSPSNTRSSGTPTTAPSSGERTSNSPTSAAPVTTDRPTSTASTPATEVSRLSGPILDGKARWELFAAGVDGLVRIAPATGRVVTSHSPVGLGFSGGNEQLVVGSSAVLIVDQDQGTSAMVVPDAGKAHRLPDVFSDYQLIWPGPKPDQWWVGRNAWLQSQGSATAARVLRTDGSPTGESMDVPSGPLTGTWFGDGDRGALYVTAVGTYRVTADGARRISSGWLLAAAGGRLLVNECDTQLRCALIMVNTGDGSRRTLPAIEIPDNYRIAELSDDGKMAVVAPQDGRQEVGLRLVDLDTGQSRQVVTTLWSGGSQSIVLSPDHAWLFVIDGTSAVRAFNTATGKEVSLGVLLTGISALAFRTGATG